MPVESCLEISSSSVGACRSIGILQEVFGFLRKDPNDPFQNVTISHAGAISSIVSALSGFR